MRLAIAALSFVFVGCGVHPGADAGSGGGGGSIFGTGGGGGARAGGGGGSSTGGGSGGGGAAGGGGGATGGGSGGGSADGGLSLRVFITSTSTRGNLGGLSGADQLCQDRANAAALNGTWKAWLSTSTVNAKDRILGAGPWVDMTGARIFANRDALAGFTGPSAGIVYSETGNFLVTSYLWTGTSITGDYHAYLPGTAPCDEWTSAAMTAYAQVGQTGRVSSAWTDFTGTSCDQNGRLICFEQ